MIQDEQYDPEPSVGGPIETPAGNWEYRFRDDDSKLTAQLAIDGGHFSEPEADFIASNLQQMVDIALRAKKQAAERQNPPRLILPPGATGPITFSND